MENIQDKFETEALKIHKSMIISAKLYKEYNDRLDKLKLEYNQHTTEYNNNKSEIIKNINKYKNLMYMHKNNLVKNYYFDDKNLLCLIEALTV